MAQSYTMRNLIMLCVQLVTKTRSYLLEKNCRNEFARLMAPYVRIDGGKRGLSYCQNGREIYLLRNVAAAMGWGTSSMGDKLHANGYGITRCH